MFRRVIRGTPAGTAFTPRGGRRTRLPIAFTLSVVLATSIAVPAPVAATPAVPTFINGLSQSVFSSNSADWVRGEGWVESNFDSDNDGRLDRIHIDITRPRETVTDSLKVPVIMEESPYYANLGPSRNWPVDHELGAPPPPRGVEPYFAASNTSPLISSIYESTWLPRGFAVVHAEAPGTGWSDGCPTSGGPNETDAGRVVIDWLNGRKPAFTTRAGTEQLFADWTTGKVAMMGTSYNGTLPIAVSTTGVQGLEAIVPISAISDWYDYYRANGMVRAPMTYQGEDLDVLADAVYSRIDEPAPGPRTICQPVIANLTANQDRITGDFSPFWNDRNYMKDVGNVHAAVLMAHGNNDWNVMTKNMAQFYTAITAMGVPHMLYFHQGGHGGAPPDNLLNLWFTRYLYGVPNGVESLPRLNVVRESYACPISSTAAGDQTNVTNVAVASSASFSVGVVPAISGVSPSRTVVAVPDATHITLSGLATTIAGASTTISGGNAALSLPAAAGATIIKTSTVSNFVAGQTIVIDAGASAESALISAVGTSGQTGTGITLAAPLAFAHLSGAVAITTTLVGATNIKVGSVTNFEVGQTINVDTGARFESAVISAVGTTGATGTGITLAAPLTIAHPPAAAVLGIVPVGTTFLPLGSVANVNAGDPLAIDTGASAEIAAVLTAGAGGSASLGFASAIGDSVIKVSSVSGMVAGKTLWIDTGANREAAVVASVGGAGATTVRIAEAAGVTVVRVVSTSGFANGSTITLGAGATAETRTVASTSTSGSNPRINLTAATANAHAVGEQVSGSGVTLAAPLGLAHAAGAAITGNAVVIAPTTLAHAGNAPVVAPNSGISVTNGALIYQCSTTYPTPYPEWPDPSASNAAFSFRPGAPGIGGLTLQDPGAAAGTETLSDNGSIAEATIANATSSANRLAYVSTPLTQQVRISGTVWVDLRLAFSKPRANVTVLLMSYPPTGNGTILDRGWMDPENRNSFSVSDPVTPGTFYDLHFDMQAKDVVVDAGMRLGVVVLSSDFELTIRPAPGTLLSVDLAASSISIPIVGGESAVGAAFGGATTTTVTADFNPTQAGHPVTFSAAVAPVVSSAGTPTGAVQFTLDGTPAGAPVPLDAAGQATWTTSGLGIGSHTVSVDYLGADYFTPSSSATLTHDVKKRLATATAVTSNLAPSTFGALVTFSATVSPENASSGIVPTGFVQFKVDGVAVGGPQALVAGVATVATDLLAAGNRNVRAQYLADPNYTGSTSPVYTQQVKKATPTGSLVSDLASPIVQSDRPTFTATFVNPVAPLGSLAPASVQFLIDGTAMGAPVALTATPTGGTASFHVTLSLPTGTHTIKARYLGNASFLAVYSSGFSLKVNP